MKEQILRLSKRLNKFTLDEIAPITELKRETLIPILDELISDKKLIKSDDVYLYNKKINTSKNISKLPLYFQCYPKDKIRLIIKCFCAEIPLLKAILILDMNRDAQKKFYSYFKEKLYNSQKERLLKYYTNEPKIPRERSLYDKKIYLYNYNNEIFITDKPLFTKKEQKPHSKDEARDILNAYYKIRRVFQNYAFTQSIAISAYEKLWMQNKEQEQKVEELVKLLNITL